MDFAAIEEARAGAGISQYALCRTAAVHATTYQRLLKRPESGHRRTVAKLESALTRMLAEMQGGGAQRAPSNG